MNNDGVVFNGSSKEGEAPQAVPKPQQQPVQNLNQPVSPPSYDEVEKKPSRLKKILTIFISFMVIIVFIAIMGYVIFGNSKNSPASSGKVTITYWGLFEDSKTMEQIISDFEKQNPNIHVEYSKQDVNQYRDRLITRINAGTGPDIFRFHNTWYPMLSEVLLPLSSDTISKENFTDIFYPVAQKDLIKNGAIYGIPLEIDTLSLFVNTQLFQSAGLSVPSTWEDFTNDARAMTVKDENGKIKTAGAGIGTYDNVTHAADILSLLFLQNGVDFKNLQATSDKVQGAFTFYTLFATDSNNVWDNTLDPSQLAFSKGNLAMYFGYSWDYFTIKQFNPNLSFQVVPVPQLQGQNVTLASYYAEGVSAKSTHQKEDLLFMKYLAKKETIQKLYADEVKVRSFGEPFARVDLADSLKANRDAYTFVSQAPNAFSSPFVDTSNSGLNQELNSYLQTAINANLNNNSSQTVLDSFLQGATGVLQKYGL